MSAFLLVFRFCLDIGIFILQYYFESLNSFRNTPFFICAIGIGPTFMFDLGCVIMSA